MLAALKKAILVALWFMFLTLPILGLKVNPSAQTVVWRWANLAGVGATAFLLTLVGALYGRHKTALASFWPQPPTLLINLRLKHGLQFVLALCTLSFPFFFSSYQVNIMTTALMYAVVGLGLYIVVGLAGLLDLGYVAFYAVGAYSYALLNYHFGLGFWAALPIGGLLAAGFGVALGFPVLRLRGDYLAIVTLGFGEIIRLVLENWNAFSFGPSGLAGIPRPGLFGLALSVDQAIRYLYYLVLALGLFTILVVNRLRDSRLGRAWVALREDEIACQAMGIDKTRTKLTAFALGASWAGMVGVLFAAKTTFVNPASFTFLESAIILSIVVLGGMGSTVGVVIGALVFILLPEYLRAFADYRMLLFGLIMVGVMVWRPQGIIGTPRRPSYPLPKLDLEPEVPRGDR
jgi:branched-chain amino acid transport system permease protein